MTSDTQAGFTIIESMLFLAISALVFIIGFAGIGSRLESVRYTDSVRNLESDVETVFRAADDGLNLRPDAMTCSVTGASPDPQPGSDTTPGTQRECAVAGVDVAFDAATAANDSFTSQSVAIATGTASGGDFNFFSAEDINSGNVNIDNYIVNAEPIGSTVDEFSLSWGLQYVGRFSGGSVPSDDVTVRYIRSPISTQTYVYSSVSGAAFAELTSPLDLCFRDSSDRSATLTIQPSATISVAYQGGVCDV